MIQQEVETKQDDAKKPGEPSKEEVNQNQVVQSPIVNQDVKSQEPPKPEPEAKQEENKDGHAPKLDKETTQRKEESQRSLTNQDLEVKVNAPPVENEKPDSKNQKEIPDRKIDDIIADVSSNGSDEPSVSNHPSEPQNSSKALK